jgi:hypothetical protein
VIFIAPLPLSLNEHSGQLYVVGAAKFEKSSTPKIMLEMQRKVS